MASKFLEGIVLANFRGIGGEQVLAPFQELNFLIGPNNAGKSAVLVLALRAGSGLLAFGKLTCSLVLLTDEDVRVSHHAFDEFGGLDL